MAAVGKRAGDKIRPECGIEPHRDQVLFVGRKGHQAGPKVRGSNFLKSRIEIYRRIDKYRESDYLSSIRDFVFFFRFSSTIYEIIDELRFRDIDSTFVDDFRFVLRFSNSSTHIAE